MVERGTHKPQKMVQFHSSAPNIFVLKPILCIILGISFLRDLKKRGRSSTVEHSPVDVQLSAEMPIETLWDNGEG